MMRLAWVLGALLVLSACTEDAPEAQDTGPEIKSVRTQVATLSEPERSRLFPSILEPPQITPLAFEVSGTLGQVDLQIGETVTEGQVLMTVDPLDYELRLQQAEADLAEAQSAFENAQAQAERQSELFERGIVSVAARDQAVTQADQAAARVERSQSNLDLTQESRGDTELRAPFDAIINSIEVQNFGAVQAGQPVATLYQDDGFQAQILVSYNVVSQLRLNDQVEVTPADQQQDIISGTITEIAQRAPAVSAFPVIITLNQPPPYLRSGMAVEVRVPLPVPEGARGFKLPVSAMAVHRIEALGQPPSPQETGRTVVFVVDPETSTIQEREVMIAGIVGNDLLVAAGLEEGEHVVTAGVTFLLPGQEVRLWEEPAS